jgi:galactokinase
MDSDIPIGKGMSSSTTMIVVLIKALLEAIDSIDKNNVEKIAQYGFMAEVLEFNEPGGMMDHYTSAVGGLLHIDFRNGQAQVEKIEREIPGYFILFDSNARKNTTQVLANAKKPVVDGLMKLKQYGINSIMDFIEDEDKIKFLKYLSLEGKRKIEANIDNYRILLEGEKMLTSENFSPAAFGALLRRHHENLRDGLNISTSFIEEILASANKNGALGGKINGSGGGGCAFVYCMEEDSERILNEVGKLGYRGTLVRQDTGVRKDREGIVV